MNGDLSYNSNSLQNYNPTTKVGIITNAIEHTGIPEKEAMLYAKADANGSSIPSINYPSKKVSIAGTIHGSSQDNLDTRIDSFKALFNGKDKNLDIDYAGSTRRYIATANTISVQRQQKALWASFSIEFICTQPFGLDTTLTNIANISNNTSSSRTVSATIGGTAPYQLPIITLTLDALTGAGDYLQVSNDANDQGILIENIAMTAGDVIVIDCAERTVKRNGFEVDYRGTFFELEPGSVNITYTDGFTTRTVDIKIDYYKRYM